LEQIKPEGIMTSKLQIENIIQSNVFKKALPPPVKKAEGELLQTIVGHSVSKNDVRQIQQALDVVGEQALKKVPLGNIVNAKNMATSIGKVSSNIRSTPEQICDAGSNIQLNQLRGVCNNVVETCKFSNITQANTLNKVIESCTQQVKINNTDSVQTALEQLSSVAVNTFDSKLTFGMNENASLWISILVALLCIVLFSILFGWIGVSIGALIGGIVVFVVAYMIWFPGGTSDNTSMYNIYGNVVGKVFEDCGQASLYEEHVNSLFDAKQICEKVPNCRAFSIDGVVGSLYKDKKSSCPKECVRALDASKCAYCCPNDSDGTKYIPYIKNNTVRCTECPTHPKGKARFYGNLLNTCQSILQQKPLVQNTDLLCSDRIKNWAGVKKELYPKMPQAARIMKITMGSALGLCILGITGHVWRS